MTGVASGRYCDDIQCPKFVDGKCSLGFIIKLRLPKNMAEAVYHNWGYIPAKACREAQKE